MKSANETSSEAAKVNSIAMLVDKDMKKIEVVTAGKEYSFDISTGEDFKEIKAFDNEVVKVNGELRPAKRVNDKLKGIKVSKWPKAFEKKIKENQKARENAEVAIAEENIK